MKSVQLSGVVSSGGKMARKSAALAMIACAAMAGGAGATDYVYSGGLAGGTFNWSDAIWTPAGVPNDAADTASISGVLEAGLTLKFDNNYTVNKITSTATGFNPVLGETASSNGLTLAGTTPSVEVGANSVLFYYGTMAGSAGLTKLGTGELSFRFNGQSNTFTGPVNINAGRMTVQHDGNFGDVENDITISSPAVNAARLFFNPSGSTTVDLPASRSVIVSGQGSFPRAEIGVNAGVTATINGSITKDPLVTPGVEVRKTDGGTLVLNGTFRPGNHLRMFGGTVIMGPGADLEDTAGGIGFGGTSTVDLGGKTDTTRTIFFDAAGAAITGTVTNGSINITADANFQVQNVATATALTNRLDLKGLTNFTYTRANRDFTVSSNANVAVSTMELELAPTSSITANNMNVGGNGANQLANSFIRMGQTTTINVNNLNIAGFRAGQSQLRFQDGLTNPTLTVRGVNGVDPATLIQIGATSSGNWTNNGLLEARGGTVDIKANKISLGRMIANATNFAVGNLNFSAGTIETPLLVLSENTVANIANNSNGVNAFVLQEGGTMKATSVVIATNTGLQVFPQANVIYTLNGGTLAAGTISPGVGTYLAAPLRRIQMNGGTLANLDAATDLVVNGAPIVVNGNGSISGGDIDIRLGGALGGTFYADAERTVTIGANARLTNVQNPIVGTDPVEFEDEAGKLIKTGSGTVVINSSIVTYKGATDVLGGVLKFNRSLTTSPEVNVTSSAILEMAAGGSNVLVTSALSLGGGGIVIMNDNDLIIKYDGVSPIDGLIGAYVSGQLISAGDFGGLPTYLALSEASDLGVTEFAGIAVDETTVLGKFTYVGDANLDGQVDALDYERVDLAIGNSGVLGTAQGDLNYDGSVDALDYEQIDLNIGNGVGSPLAAVTGGVFIPEPASLSLVAVAGGLMARRRRA
jgi:fibronectin-binding autotransporter adhesin